MELLRTEALLIYECRKCLWSLFVLLDNTEMYALKNNNDNN